MPRSLWAWITIALTAAGLWAIIPVATHPADTGQLQGSPTASSGDAASPPSTAAPTIEVVMSDQTVPISGYLGDPAAFVAYVELVARGGQVDEFEADPSDLDLQRADGQTQVRAVTRANVVVDDAATLPEGDPVDVRIEVTNLPESGIYTGEIRFRVNGREQPQRVKLKVEAKARPALTPEVGSERVPLVLVRCGGSDGKGPDCALAQRLLPKGTKDARPVRFRNAQAAPVEINAVDVLLADDGGDVLPPGAIPTPSASTTVPAGGSGGVTLSLNRGKMPSGHYAGFVYVTAAGAADRLQLPADLSVRGGPLTPLGLLIMGLGLGLIIKLASPGTVGSLRATAGQGAIATSGSGRLLTALVFSAPDGRVTSARVLGLIIKTVLFLLLVAIGMRILYVDGAATLGAGGASDYLPFFLWGLSADIASRTLSNVGDLWPSN